MLSLEIREAIVTGLVADYAIAIRDINQLTTAQLIVCLQRIIEGLRK